MSRYERFTFVCNPYERQLIETLAEQLQRSQSDAVRYVIREAIRQISVVQENHQKDLFMASQESG